MQTLYEQVHSFDNLLSAWQETRKGKTRKTDLVKFEKDLERNLLDLQFELKNKFYKPLPLSTFPLHDPKTRKISKSDIRDRVVHHALVRVIEPIFESSFIYDSCANRKGKGTLFAVRRFEKFKRKVSKNDTASCFVLKADIKHYFEEIHHEILLELLKRKVTDVGIIWLAKQILKADYTNFKMKRERE